MHGTVESGPCPEDAAAQTGCCTSRDGGKGCGAQRLWAVVGKHWLCTGIQARKGDLAVLGILVLTVTLGGNFKAGNEECSQTQPCHTECRVSSSSQCRFMGCLGPVWAGSSMYKQEEISLQPCSVAENCNSRNWDAFCSALIKFVHTLFVSRLKRGAGDLSFFPLEISPCSDICPGHTAFLPRVRDSRYRNAVPSSTSGTGWTG